MQHLELLFDKELFQMKSYYFKNYQIKSNQQLTLKLSEIHPCVKAGLLKEYFKMCKMMFRIRSLVTYVWDTSGRESSLKIRQLYNENKTFIQM